MWHPQASTLLLLGLLAITPSAAAQDGARRPNVVVILVDDLGYADLSFLGSLDMRTPRIDSLARDGVYFTSGYATCAVCSPSRAALLTGRYQQRFGHEFNLPHSPNRRWGLPSSEVTLAQILGREGYRTVAVGKWHLGLTDNFHPLDRGFEHFYGFLLGGRSYFPQPVGKGSKHKRLQRDRELIEHEDFSYLTDELGEEAAKYIERFRDEPFFLYLAFSAVHGPLEAPLDRAPAEGDSEGKRSTLVAMTASLDRAVGRVLDALDAHELTENTLVFFLSDNGGQRTNASDNGPLRGNKGTYFEGGVRIPYLLRWPGVAPAGGRFDGTVSTLDLVPTVLGAVGLSRELDGVDLRPYLTGERKASPHDVLYWRFGNLWGIRQGDWKVVQEEQGAPMLFHLGRDLGETTDLAAEEPERLAELRRTWEAWSAEMRPGRWRDPQAAQTKETTIAEGRTRVSFYLGKRSLDDLFRPVEDQSTLGVGFSRETPGSSVGWEFGFLTSEDDETATVLVFDPFLGFGLLDVAFDASTLEFYGGIHKTFGDPASKVHPFVGGGLSLMMVELDIDLFGFGSDDDDVIGVYIHGGFAFDITETFALGLDYRIFKGPDVELFGTDGSADYDQLALLASFSF